MKKLLIALSILMFLINCDRKDEDPEIFCYNTSQPPTSENKFTIEQGIWGDVWFWSGNFMPNSRGEICQVQREVLIYELTALEEVVRDGNGSFYSEIQTNLVTSVMTDTHGFFEVTLDPGSYSIFVKEGDAFYSNQFISGNIFQVTLDEGTSVGITFNITYEAYF